MRITGIACHESAHAVISISLGLPVDLLSLNPPQCVYEDSTAGSYGGGAVAPALSDRQRWRAATIRALAGPVAESRFSGESVAACLRRNQSDRNTAVGLASGLVDEGMDRDAVLRQLLQQTRRLVDRHWDAILRVARALQIHSALYGFEVERIVRRAQLAA
jgi:hypothetical protein